MLRNRLIIFAFFILLGFAPFCHAQNIEIVEPEDDLLLEFTQEWGSERSTLGNLKKKKIGNNDLELRFWAGYGLFGTRGLILEKEDDIWTANKANVENCFVYYPDSLKNTISKENFFSNISTTDCNEDQHEFGSVREVDTVLVSPIKIKNTELDKLWNSMVKIGLSDLPTHVDRDWIMTDGHTYVVELRKKNLYKASVIEHLEEPEVKADQQIKNLAKLVSEKFDFAFLRGPTNN